MFEIFVDSAANIPAEEVKKYGIHVISFVNYVNGKPVVNFDPELTYEQERAKGKEYYDAVRAGAEVKTSLVNTADFEERFAEVLKEGKDVLYFSLSKNISGTFNAASIAAEDLKEEYPERKVLLVDSLNASLAQGMLAIYAYRMREKGVTIEEAQRVLQDTAYKMNGVFTVDDLKHLAKTGRINTATAIAGNVLNVKPILRGNAEGFIVQHKKLRGRKKALEALINYACDNMVEPEKQILGIAHADSYEDSLYVVDEIQKRTGVKEVINTSYDYCTGSHVGPDTIALFFIGYDRELEGKTADYVEPELFSMI